MNSLNYHFDLICHFVWRDFSLRYKRSILGLFWSLMLPIAQLLVLVFLFRRIIPLDIDRYPAFVFTALLPWTWFNSCLSSAGILFISNRNLVRHPDFAPTALVIINILSNLLNYLIAIPILIVMLFIYDKNVTLALLSLPLLMLIQSILTAGMSLIISTLNVFYRDVQYIVNVALMLMFYITPVFYQSQSVSEKYRVLYTLNPIAVLIKNYRAIFFYGIFPEWGSLLYAGIVSIVMCCLGYFIYKRCLPDVIDTL